MQTTACFKSFVQNTYPSSTVHKRLPVTEKLRTIIINGRYCFCPYYHFGAKREKKNRVISFHITSATHQRIEYPNFEDVIPSAKWIYENLIVRKN